MTRFLSFYCQTAVLFLCLSVTALAQLSAQDTIPPKISCLEYLNTSIVALSGTTLSVPDFYISVTDNVTPSEQLIPSLRKAGTGTGYPVDEMGAPVSDLLFACNELGVNDVEVWVKDEAGNTAHCDSKVFLNNLFGACTSPVFFTGSGKIVTPLGSGIEDVGLYWMNEFAGNAVWPVGYGQFEFFFANLQSELGSLTPVLDADPLNGVNTWDAMLISRHILNLVPFDNPFQLLAADVNQSGTVTSYDIIEIRKLILGAYSTFPLMPSWRFISAHQVFNQPDNPFADSLITSVPLVMVQPDLHYYDFIGIKSGDVDFTASPNQLAGGTDERVLHPVLFVVESDKIEAKAGDIVTLSVQPDEASVAYQLALQTPGMTVLSAHGGPSLSDDHFFTGADFVRVVSEQGNAPFTITARMERDGDPNEMVSSDAQAIAPRAYSGDGTPREIVLSPQHRFAHLSVSPNPWNEQTRLFFGQPASGTVSLNVYDAIGRQVLNREQWVEKGSGSISINAADIGNGKGWFTCVLTGSFGQIQQKILR